LKAILIRPQFDEATGFTFDWAEQVLVWCREAGIDTVDLAKDEAVRDKVEEELKKGTDLIIFYDHGNEDALWGQDDKPVFDLKNCHWLANKEVYTLACLSAKKLGAEVWKLGGKYWGYNETFGFTTDSIEEFKKAANCGFAYLFIEGTSHLEAVDRARSMFNELAQELVSQGKIMGAIFMRKNGEHLVCYNGGSPQDNGASGCLVGIIKIPLHLAQALWKKAKR
jgi:hypothetical protein